MTPNMNKPDIMTLLFVVLALAVQLGMLAWVIVLIVASTVARLPSIGGRHWWWHWRCWRWRCR